MFTASTEDNRALQSNLQDVFITPFERQSSQRFVMLQNLANSHPDCMRRADGSLREAYNYVGRPDQRAILKAESKGTRLLVPTRGNTLVQSSIGIKSVLDEYDHQAAVSLARGGLISRAELLKLAGIEETTRNYICYLLEVGILVPRDLDSFLLVPDYTDFDTILRRASAHDCRVVAYNPVPDFMEVCQDYGLTTYGRTTPAVARLGTKHHFRELIRARYPQFSIQPYAWFGAGMVPKESQLESLMHYYRQPSGITHDVLFVQKDVVFEGLANYRISRHSDGGFSVSGLPHRLLDTRELAQFIGRLGSGVEVAPFVRLEASPSMGLVVGRDGVSCVAPFQQLLDEDNGYIGFKLNRRGSLSGFSPEVGRFMQKHLSQLLSISLEIGRFQQAEGYIGYSSIDTLIYRDPVGELQLAFSEENLRYTGTCMLQMLVYGREDLRRRLLDGQLSLMQYDVVRLSPPIIELTQGVATEVVRQLRLAAIPLVDHYTSEGIVLMAKPNRAMHGFTVSIGIIASSDEARDGLFERAVSVLT